MADSRRRTRRASASPRAAERHLHASRPVEPSQDTPHGPAPIDELLHNVRELRLTFVADLASAAGAVEAGAPEVAADIVDADRNELARFLLDADDQLRELEAAAMRPAPHPRWRRRAAIALPAIPLVGALTMSAAAALGVLPLPGTGTHSNAPAHASARVGVPALAQFENVIDGDSNAQQVIAAGNQLHAQIATLLATTGNNPADVTMAAQLLQLERNLLITKQPPGAAQLLRATDSLLKQLRQRGIVIAPAATTTPNAAVQVASPSPSSSPTKKATSSPSPTPTKKASTSPSPSPTPSSSSTTTAAPGPIPKVGG